MAPPTFIDHNRVCPDGVRLGWAELEVSRWMPYQRAALLEPGG